ncbi:hypothetical protein [Oleiharenicola lentus]|uniref:hypothetical protein n=1 Tax=Oleiharenicola lentus TaxID=2508720 RepID=UPI003F67C0B7
MSRTRLCFYIILLTPLLVYWQTVFLDYGLRDDYSHLRESREEPGKMVKFTTSQGRPLYGALLETSFGHVETVSNLRWLRLGGVVLLTLLAFALWRQLYRSGWSEVEAMAIGLGVALLPAAQVTAGWAIGWPYALSLLLAVAGFSAIETELERGGLKRVVAFLGGCLIYMLAGLIYQSNAMFAVVVIGAVLLVRTGREPLLDLRWLVIHLSALFIGLVASYVLVKFLFASGMFEASPRMRLESDPVGKLVWFFANPLPNATALYALRDMFGTGAAIFWSATGLMAAFIGIAGKFVPDVVTKRKWLLCVCVLPFVAHAVSFAAAERAVGYRVLFALSALMLVLVVFTLRLLRETKRVHRKATYVAFAALLGIAAISAWSNSLGLIAEPQGREWALIKNGVQRYNFKTATKVYIITPTPDDRSTERMFADEFGSLTSDSDWAPREMFHNAIYERYGERLPKGASYTVVLGREQPAVGAYDVVIDMRQLRAARSP